MLRVYACLTEQHDLRLVFLAGLICIAACLISLNLFVHANGAERGRPLSWLLGAATVFGAGVWAFHFISELAYEPGFPVGYDAGLTAISLVAAIGAVWLAMFVAHRFAAAVLGGAMIGAGIAAMHYIGMAALRAPAQLHWDAGYVLASLAIAMTFAAAAMRVSSWGPVLWGRFMAVVLLVLAIVGLHFTAMAAVTLVPDPLIAVPSHAVTPTVLAVLIATVTALIAALGLLDLIVDDHLALRAAHEAERLRRSADHLARAQRIAHTGSIEQDLQTGAIEWFGETYQIFGLDPNLPAPVGEAFLALFHPDDRAACETQGPAHQAAAAGQLRNKPHVSLRFRIVQPGGTVKLIHHESELVLDQRGAAIRWIGTYKDVTEAVEAEESFRLLFEGNPVPMWLFDPETLKFLAVNDAATAHYGYDRESFSKMTLLDMVPQEDRHDVKNAIRNTPDLCGGGPGHVWQHVKADGTEIDVLTFWRHTMFCDRPAQLVAIVDVTAKRQAEARIAHMAHHDALTGLPNRVLFHERLDETLSRVRRHAEVVAVLYLDLDQFKSVNDTLGHPAGDKLLVAVAERLRTCLRDCDMVARFGGDEFAVLQIGLAGPHEAGALADRIVTLLSEPYDIEGQQAVIGTSVGIALAPADGETSDQLLRNADIALYQAKEDGRRVFRFFEPGMDARLRVRRTLELDLRKALAAGEFELYYQPLITLETGVISGFEALLRWHHPLRGMVAPAEFIPLAEEIGLIVPIGEWVLRQACAEAAGWPDDLKVAVNLSLAQFKKGNLPQMVFATLASAGLPAARLELEITESIFLANSETNLAILRSLRALGVGVSMDDFGTGYSGLSYLRAFPFDKIKIDRSFISELGERADCMAIIKAITNLGSNLGIPTLAEGAETETQLAWLREAGCTEMQGYLFSRPVPASEIAGLPSSRRNCRQADEYLLTA
jgi:diguanylate cyclase (GGDEF)-like protein/PAS domain S-box-containing protein